MDAHDVVDGDAVEMGLCQCGCGKAAPIARSTDLRRGYVKGQPVRYRPGHNRGPTRKGPDHVLEDRGYTTPCWIWQHTCSSNGYGCVWTGTANVGAHRWYYEQHVGPIPSGLTIDHLCRVRNCVNPAHLEAVTQRVNGERRLDLKLNRRDAIAIRDSSESNRALAAQYGVHPDHIKHIKAGTRWTT